MEIHQLARRAWLTARRQSSDRRKQERQRFRDTLACVSDNAAIILTEMLMPTSLYDLSVGSYLQVVGAAAAFLEKGAAHCAEKGIALEEVVGTSLYPDMATFHFQALCVTHHSIGAVKGMQEGEFGRPAGYPDMISPACKNSPIKRSTNLKRWMLMKSTP